jgi:hypothetical protein
MMTLGVGRCFLASIAQTRLRGSSVAGLDTLKLDRRLGRLTSVAPKSFARQKVGRAILRAPREIGKTRAFWVFSDARGALGTVRPTSDRFGQHALTLAPTPVNIVFSFTGK